MKIHSVEFKDYTTGQKIEKLGFDNLNLLVGVSGAGKTQILKILLNYISVASRASKFSFIFNFAGHFEINFSIHNMFKQDDWISKEVVWRIDTSRMNKISEPFNQYAYGISNESLSVNGKEIIFRDLNQLRINAVDTANIASVKSVLGVFNSPNDIEYVCSNFFTVSPNYGQKNVFQNVPLNEFEGTSHWIKDNNLTENNFLLFIHNYSTLLQIALVRAFNSELFNEFLSRLQSIFPNIEDLKIDAYKNLDISNDNSLTLYINENGKWISMDAISGGILKVIYILASVEFSVGNTTIFIDELENSLGINCLDSVTDYIIEKSTYDNIQFIVTSHHPYIINNISAKNWRIISQNAGIISSKSADEIGIDTKNNRQEQFFQLINYMGRQF